MNVFKILDEAIRGAILFVFDYFYISYIILRHPSSGATRLARRARRSGTDQLSSLTYLALSMLAAIAMLNSLVFRPGYSSETSGPVEVSRFFAGSSIGSNAHLIIGAFAATALLAAFIRLITRWTTNTPDQSASFVAGAEYIVGLSALCASTWPWTADILTRWASRRDYWSYSNGIEIALFVVIIPFFVLSSVALGNHLEANLRRKRGVKPAARLRRGKATWSYEVFLASLALTGSLAILMAAMLVGRSLAGFLLEEERGARPLRLEAFSCDLMTPRPTAAVVIQNLSPRDGYGWLEDLELSVYASPARRGGLRSFPLVWQKQIAGNRHTDFIARGEWVEVSGDVAIPTTTRQALNGYRVWCFVRLKTYGTDTYDSVQQRFRRPDHTDPRVP